jgi:hypothetical protein
MSYGYPGMPGMQIYGGFVPDAPSGVTDLPLAQHPSALGLPGASGAYNVSGSFDVSAALIVFVIVYFGAVGGLHFLSNAADRV